MKEIQIKLSKEGKTEILAFGLTSDEVIESMSIAYIQSIHTINDLPIRKCLQSATDSIFSIYKEIVDDPELEKEYFIINKEGTE